MASTEVRGRSRPARRRGSERTSNRVAAARSGETSRQQQAQMKGLQWYASASQAKPRRPRAAARQEYRRDRCLPLQSPAVDSTQKPEPSAQPVLYDAKNRVIEIQSPNRKVRMPVSLRT